MNTNVSKPESANQVDLRTRTELWTGILGGPVVWLIQFQTIYTLAGWGCALHTKLPLYITSAFFFLLVVIIGFIALRHLHPNESEEAQRRTRFMAQVGIMSSVLSLLLIVSQAIATIMLSQCME